MQKKFTVQTHVFHFLCNRYGTFYFICTFILFYFFKFNFLNEHQKIDCPRMGKITLHYILLREKHIADIIKKILESVSGLC